jgi:light-regulated signal transduction histidine kinase (bacteriophytochrome)
MMAQPDRRPLVDARAEPDQQNQWLQFASSAAHEIVGPVEQVLSLVALFVQRYRGKLDSEAETLLDFMERARARIGTTAAGLRKCFQVGSMPCIKAHVDMNEIVSSALHGLETQISESGADVKVEALPAAQGDRDLLVILFQTIIQNALKFHGSDVRPKLLISSVHSSHGQIYQLRDNGIGIDARDTEIVFEAFRKLNGLAYEGAGLGLTLARMVVELHGGSIWIEQTTEDTVVRFELPS